MKRITYELQGECKRCGACCRARECDHLTSEKINDIEVSVCGMHGSFWRAHACVVYPISPTAHDLFKGCGFSWKVIKEEIT